MANAHKREDARARKILTQARLKEVLHYDPETGVFLWRVDIICGRGKGRPIVRAGDVAGCVVQREHTCYRAIAVDGQTIYAHRLAFLYVTGSIPPLVDHWDTDGLNNAWANLREATKSQNNANTRTQKNNRVGFKGVMRDKHRKKWIAQIKPNGKSTHLGTFETIQEARAAYAAAARAIFGEFARTK